MIGISTYEWKCLTLYSQKASTGKNDENHSVHWTMLWQERSDNLSPVTKWIVGTPISVEFTLNFSPLQLFPFYAGTSVCYASPANYLVRNSTLVHSHFANSISLRERSTGNVSTWTREQASERPRTSQEHLVKAKSETKRRSQWRYVDSFTQFWRIKVFRIGSRSIPLDSSNTCTPNMEVRSGELKFIYGNCNSIKFSSFCIVWWYIMEYKTIAD